MRLISTLELPGFDPLVAMLAIVFIVSLAAILIPLFIYLDNLTK